MEVPVVVAALERCRARFHASAEAMDAQVDELAKAAGMSPVDVEARIPSTGWPRGGGAAARAALGVVAGVRAAAGSAAALSGRWEEGASEKVRGGRARAARDTAAALVVVAQEEGAWRVAGTGLAREAAASVAAASAAVAGGWGAGGKGVVPGGEDHAAARLLAGDAGALVCAAAMVMGGGAEGRPMSSPFAVASVLRGVAAVVPLPPDGGSMLWKMGGTAQEAAWVGGLAARVGGQDLRRRVLGRWGAEDADAPATGRAPPARRAYPWNQTLLVATHVDQHGRAYCLAGRFAEAGVAASAPLLDAVVWAEPAAAAAAAAASAKVRGTRSSAASCKSCPLRGGGGDLSPIQMVFMGEKRRNGDRRRQEGRRWWWGCVPPRPPLAGDRLVLTGNLALWEYPHILATPTSGGQHEAVDPGRASGHRFKSQAVTLAVASRIPSRWPPRETS